MWTAKLIDKSKVEDRIVVRLEFTDGTTTLGDEVSVRNFQKGWIKRYVIDKLRVLNDRDAEFTAIKSGDIDTTVTPEVKPTVDAARQQFIKDLNLYRQMLKAVDLGLVLTTSKKLLNLKTKLKGEFLPSYIDLL